MKSKNKKIIKIIKTIINVVGGLFLAAFIVVVCLQRFSDNKISFFNFRIFTVVSESMKPKYDIGDVLIAKEVEPKEVKVGDTISYQGMYGDLANKVITHQVTKVEIDENGKYLFHAKGLANIVEDPVLTEDQLYGVVVYKSAILSLVYRIVGTSIGFYLFIIVPILYIIGSEVIGAMLEKEEKRRNKEKNKE